MSFVESLTISICRSSVMGLISLWLAHRVHQWILSSEGTGQAGRWGLVMTPFFTPGLLVGFCYRDTRLNLSHLPVLNESLYFLLVLGMTLPVGVLLLQFLPPPAASPQAQHLAFLARRRQIGSFANRLSLNFHGNWGRRLLAAAGVFLISFQEAEIASLLRTATWTEWLFTMQAGGLVNPSRYLVWVVPCELFCILLLLPKWIMTRQQASSPVSSAPPRRRQFPLAEVWVCLSLLLVTVIPLFMLMRGAFRGAGIVFQQPSFPREIFDALLLAVTGAILTLLILNGVNSVPSSAWKRSLMFLIAVPGLLGALSLGLGLAAIFQADLLNPAYDTPGPLVLGIVFYLLPRGIIVSGCLLTASRREDHLAWQLRQSSRFHQQQQGLNLHWVARGNRWYWVTVLLFFWAYFELMLPSILTPPGMAPAPLLLYNALHYGRISALAAKLLITSAIPVCLLALVWFVRRPLLKWFY